MSADSVDLRAWRKKHGLTLQQAGELTGVNKNTFNRYEHGWIPHTKSRQKVEAAIKALDEKDIARKKAKVKETKEAKSEAYRKAIIRAMEKRGMEKRKAAEGAKAREEARARARRAPLFPSQVLSLVLESVHTGRYFMR